MENWKNIAKLIRSLKDKKARDEEGLFVVEGEKMVLEALDSDYVVAHIFASKDSVFQQISAKLTASANCPCDLITETAMEKISLLASPSPCLALVRKPVENKNWEGLIGQECLALALDGVRDPGNLGTILRLSDWFGVDIIFLSDASSRYPTSDIYNPKVVQATMGAIFRKKVVYAPLPEIAQIFRKKGMNVYGTFLEGKSIYQQDLSRQALIVMGNESEGISPEMEQTINQKLFIPPYPANALTSESLNVATATAITLSEFRRR